LRHRLCGPALGASADGGKSLYPRAEISGQYQRPTAAFDGAERPTVNGFVQRGASGASYGARFRDCVCHRTRRHLSNGANINPATLGSEVRRRHFGLPLAVASGICPGNSARAIASVGEQLVASRVGNSRHEKTGAAISVQRFPNG